jgi:hypothetical protein
MQSLKATHTGSWLAGLTMLTMAVSTAPAGAQVSPAPCPVGYWHYGSLCLNDSTGDVVLASAVPAAPVELGCRPGYWRYDALCQNLSTGDVELAETGTRSARADK